MVLLSWNLTNFRVDGTTRLPNWSLCPPRYNPDAWWQLNSIQSATFQVLDLEGFCQTIGLAAGIKGKVIDVKVSKISFSILKFPFRRL